MALLQINAFGFAPLKNRSIQEVEDSSGLELYHLVRDSLNEFMPVDKDPVGSNLFQYLRTPHKHINSKNITYEGVIYPDIVKGGFDNAFTFDGNNSELKNFWKKVTERSSSPSPISAIFSNKYEPSKCGTDEDHVINDFFPPVNMRIVRIGNVDYVFYELNL